MTARPRGAANMAGRYSLQSANNALTISQNQPTDDMATMPITIRASCGRASVESHHSLMAKKLEVKKKAKPVQRAVGRDARNIAAAMARRPPAHRPRRSWENSP